MNEVTFRKLVQSDVNTLSLDEKLEAIMLINSQARDARERLGRDGNDYDAQIDLEIAAERLQDLNAALAA